MTNTYDTDRGWSNDYIPALKQIAGPLLLQEADLELDMCQATDLIVFTARDLRIGCRVRRPGYDVRYPWDFTIRSRRESGAETELSKILGGWGDLLVYAHAAVDPHPRLSRWFVIDLDAFRSGQGSDFELWNQTHQSAELPNGDGTFFRSFDVRRWPWLVLSASVRIPAMVAA